MAELERESILYFRDQFREARRQVFDNAEDFDKIIHVVERLGSYLFERKRQLQRTTVDEESKTGLGKYKAVLAELVSDSAFGVQPNRDRSYHAAFNDLFEFVRLARNDAIHEGAFARHLATHSQELSLMLEESLMAATNSRLVSDFMVRNPICAELWQPISFVRQTMLQNSFSYLPLHVGNNDWKLISDIAIAKYLTEDSNTRKRHMPKQINELISEFVVAKFAKPTDSIASLYNKIDAKPILVLDPNDPRSLMGIITAFDLL